MKLARLFRRSLRANWPIAWALAILVQPSSSYASAPSCRGGPSYIDVDTIGHRLSLCVSSALKASYDVRLGRGGVGKTRAGDGRTPLGTYRLGRPRASTRYGMFIPIGYPTEAQRARGYTGNAVGIHGPDRGFAWLGPLINAFDTTWGCVGLAKDEEMLEISRWMRQAGASVVVLRPEIEGAAARR
jgi:hypothetical protein